MLPTPSEPWLSKKYKEWSFATDSFLFRVYIWFRKRCDEKDHKKAELWQKHGLRDFKFYDLDMSLFDPVGPTIVSYCGVKLPWLLVNNYSYALTILSFCIALGSTATVLFQSRIPNGILISHFALLNVVATYTQWSLYYSTVTKGRSLIKFRDVSDCYSNFIANQFLQNGSFIYYQLFSKIEELLSKDTKLALKFAEVEDNIYGLLSDQLTFITLWVSYSRLIDKSAFAGWFLWLSLFWSFLCLVKWTCWLYYCIFYKLMHKLRTGEQLGSFHTHASWCVDKELLVILQPYLKKQGKSPIQPGEIALMLPASPIQPVDTAVAVTKVSETTEARSFDAVHAAISSEQSPTPTPQ